MSAPGVYLEIDEATAIAGKPIQVSICVRDENGGGYGSRIAGPKFGGSGSRRLKSIRIDKRTADDIASYLGRVTA